MWLCIGLYALPGVGLDDIVRTFEKPYFTTFEASAAATLGLLAHCLLLYCCCGWPKSAAGGRGRDWWAGGSLHGGSSAGDLEGSQRGVEDGDGDQVRCRVFLGVWFGFEGGTWRAVREGWRMGCCRRTGTW